ncbi:hypothetical protein BVRB_032620, partial [Beta vulgaris subsp. vulgaris]
NQVLNTKTILSFPDNECHSNSNEQQHTLDEERILGVLVAERVTKVTQEIMTDDANSDHVSSANPVPETLNTRPIRSEYTEAVARIDIPADQSHKVEDDLHDEATRQSMNGVDVRNRERYSDSAGSPVKKSSLRRRRSFPDPWPWEALSRPSSSNRSSRSSDYVVIEIFDDDDSSLTAERDGSLLKDGDHGIRMTPCACAYSLLRSIINAWMR